MAIFNMEDSSLNEFLSGGMSTSSFNEADRTLKNYRKSPEDEKTDILGYGHRDYSKYSDDDLKKSFNSISNTAARAKKDRSDYYNHSFNGSFEREEAANAGKELKKRGYDPKAIREKGKKENELKEKIINRRKIEEAAEYILSVLDEMDYMEESEKNK